MPTAIAHLRVMRLRNLTFFGVLIVCVVVLLTLLITPPRRPFEVRLLDLQPSGIIDDQGEEMLLAYLEAFNPSIGTVFCWKERQQIPVKIAQHWSEVESRWSIGGLWPHERRVLVLLLSARTEVCRLSFKWQREPRQISWWRQLGRRSQQAGERILSTRLVRWMNPHTIAPTASRWQPIDLDIVLPKESVRIRSASAPPPGDG